ncbi:CDP-glycerol glycerophosphotransferase family protein [Peribacillus psychrosaccharolyticus]|uniref:CDP-glycerol glycerophosphotransferase family protein n=1 Tax=Peribacillus psychrosaccharolyticus TaxID=1407 RepID=UPI003D2E75F9
MARELAIRLYLRTFSILFSIFSILPLKSKAVFVTSFGDNTQYLLDEMDKQELTWKRVILRTSTSKIKGKDDGHTIVFNFETKNIIHLLLSIYHLATAKRIIVDNYFGFLAAISFRPGVTCTQIWHAAGAIKKFGLTDPSIAERTPATKQRFIDVYNMFDHVVVGSDVMAGIFKESFGLTDKHILYTGIPRTDFFFNQPALTEAQRILTSRYPEWADKKTILYAPTFRNQTLHSGKIALDIDLLYRELSQKGYVLLLKLHPAVTADVELESAYPGFVHNLSDYPDMNELLLAADCLVTDYSSIPFEYSFLGKPMYFYAYDLEEYQQERGFWEDYTTSMPGPVSRTTNELIEHIKRNGIDQNQLSAFNQKWNRYSTGQSSKNLVDFLFKNE